MLKDMLTVTLAHPGTLLDRLQVQNSRQSRFKISGHRQPHSHHSDLEGRDPQKQIPPVHTMTSRIHHTRTHTHTQIPCTPQCGTPYQVHHTWEAGNCGMRKVPSQASMGTKITHADYCMCVCMCCV